MNEQLSREDLRRLLQNKNIEDLSYSQISLLIKNEEKISESIPDGICQIDPRNGDRIIYSSARSLRPHDTRLIKEQCSVNNHKNCLICRGETTGVVDVAELSQGFTFINKNLFPILYPESCYKNDLDNLEMLPFSSKGQSAIGFHFLQ
jgi:hypothetical protein